MLDFKELSPWQGTAFCAALLERMLPNYQLFTQVSAFGDYKLLRNQLDLIWQKLSASHLKINIEAQVNKLELQIPDPEKFDFFGVYPAIDTCMALMVLLQEGQENNVDYITQVSQLSLNSVSYYIECLAAQDADHNEAIDESIIAEHPLMQWEIETQQEVFHWLLSAPENKASCQQLKKLVLAEGLSTLGIEIG